MDSFRDSSIPQSPASTASTASILSDGEIVPARKRVRLSSKTSTNSTASLVEKTSSDPAESASKDSQDEPNPMVSDVALATASPRYQSPYSHHNGFQLEESPEQFLQRLPPSTTTLEQVGDWIWMYNPYFDRSSLPTSNEHAFVIEGDAILRSFDTYAEDIQMSDYKPKAKQTMIKKQREHLPLSLKNAAKEHGVTHGKWMLFPSEKDVDQVWLRVVQATAEGKLGPSAKVAPAGSSPGRDRLICVYTKDFADIDDVSRVLMELKICGLLPTGSRPIYYKADAWTYLGIDSKNNYGLRASLYSSQDFLKTNNDSKRKI